MNIKVVSLNLWHGNLFSAALDFLKSTDADIILLQEVYNGTDPTLPDGLRAFAVLQQKLGYKYGDFAPSLKMRRKEGHILQGNAVLSKFPVKGFEPVFFNEPYAENCSEGMDAAPTQPRSLQHVEATTSHGVVNVFNLQGVWDMDGDNYSERRRIMSEKMIAAVKDKKNVILAGDTNAKHTNQAMRSIEAHVTSVFGDTLATTFNVRRKDLVKFPGYATAVVDLMFVSADITILEHDCPDVDVSDHLPLIATLKIG